jgi:uroporphyrinogen decarboxylase
MTEKERVRRCIRFEAVDRAPWQFGYTSELAEQVMKEMGLGEQKCTVLGRNIFRYSRLDEFFGNHITFLRNRAVDSVLEVETGIWRDEWGVLWDRRIDRDIGSPVNCLLEDMDIDRLTVPDLNTERRFAHFFPLIRANQHRYLIVKFSYSLFERAWSLRGMERLLMDFILNPGFVHELFSRITEFNLKLITNLKEYPIDGIIFGDDWGWQRGLFIHPDMWRRFLKPYLEKLYSRARTQGYDVFIHSCGDITPVLDDLVEIGVDVFNPFQPEVMDISDIFRLYSGRLAFYGGISIQQTLPFGTPDDVKKEVKHLLELWEKYGGYILSPSHDMPKDIPLENILAMMEAIGLPIGNPL